MTQFASGAVLPEGTADFFKRRAAEITGIVLIGCALILLTALLSFTPADPSFNHATDAVPGKLSGFPRLRQLPGGNADTGCLGAGDADPSVDLR